MNLVQLWCKSALQTINWSNLVSGQNCISAVASSTILFPWIHLSVQKAVEEPYPTLVTIEMAKSADTIGGTLMSKQSHGWSSFVFCIHAHLICNVVYAEDSMVQWASNVAPVDRVVDSPPLSSFFPCKRKAL